MTISAGGQCAAGSCHFAPVRYAEDDFQKRTAAERKRDARSQKGIPTWRCSLNRRRVTNRQASRPALTD